ncbi:hypothetical protein ACWIUD_07275 [Helicobacter sp. 23-1044]
MHEINGHFLSLKIIISLPLRSESPISPPPLRRGIKGVGRFCESQNLKNICHSERSTKCEAKNLCFFEIFRFAQNDNLTQILRIKLKIAESNAKITHPLTPSAREGE